MKTVNKTKKKSIQTKRERERGNRDVEKEITYLMALLNWNCGISNACFLVKILRNQKEKNIVVGSIIWKERKEKKKWNVCVSMCANGERNYHLDLDENISFCFLFSTDWM